MSKKVQMLVNYENKWVALNETQNKVVASANNLADLHKKIQEADLKKNIILTWVPPFDAALAPNATI